MEKKFHFEGLITVVRATDKINMLITAVDRDTDVTRFIKIRERDTRQASLTLELSDVGTFAHARTVILKDENPSELWPDIKARFYYNGRAWKTCFYVKPSVIVHHHQPRRSMRDADAAGANIATGITKIEGRTAVNKLAAIVTSRSKTKSE